MKLSKEIVLIGGLNSVGVPYTRDNKNHLSHFNLLSDYLSNLGFKIRSIDMYSMSKYNTTEVLNDYLDTNISYAQIKENQIGSIDPCRRQGFFQWLQLSTKTKKIYKREDKDKVILLADELKKDPSIFIYSCGANDFFKMMDTGLGQMLKTKELSKVLKNAESTVTKITLKIEKNIGKIKSLNPNTEIYVLGLYIPTTLSYIRKKITEPINIFNKHIEELCQKYNNVYFVDNANLTKKEMAPIDWHPNKKGQIMIGENIIREIEKNSKIIK